MSNENNNSTSVGASNANQGWSSSFLERLTAYPLVKYGCETTRYLYNEAKEKNTYVKKGLHLAESSVGTVAASPLVQNVSKTCEPFLSKADQFGCSQLDKAESNIFNPAAQLYESANATITSRKKIVDDTVSHLFSATRQQLVALPTVLTNRVLDFAENSVEYYLPEFDDQSNGEEKEEKAVLHHHHDETVVVTVKSVVARSSTISQRAYRRVQRRAAYRARIARLYGESILTKSPFAVNVVNYARTRDPEIKSDIVQQVNTTLTYCKDKVKGVVAESPLFQKASTLLQPYLENVSVQSFYALLLTLLATVTSTLQPKNKTTKEEESSSPSPSSPEAASTSAEQPARPLDDPDTDDADADADEEDAAAEADDTAGPAEPDAEEQEDDDDDDDDDDEDN